jgi:hypothetical protein
MTSVMYPFLPVLLCIPKPYWFSSVFLSPFQGPLYPVSKPFSLHDSCFYLCSRFLWNVYTNPWKYLLLHLIKPQFFLSLFHQNLITNTFSDGMPCSRV